MHDERSLSFLDHVVVAMSNAVQQGIDDHEAKLHRGPKATCEPTELQAVPFPDRHIPDTTLARMVETLETMETDDTGIPVVAKLFEYPESLVSRELADYKARFRRFIRHRANA